MSSERTHTDAVREGIRKERERCLGLIAYAREEGEGDLRQVRYWIESGECAETLRGAR